ncbi:MAG: H-NS histone family protein [Burkholderiaceae bacterium]
MATLQDLISQKEALEREIERTRQQARSETIAQIRSLMEEHGLTAADLSTRARSKAATAKTGKVAPKYRDASTGETWSGRGLQPRWLKAALAAGRKISDFAI